MSFIKRLKNTIINWWNGDFYMPTELVAINLGRPWPLAEPLDDAYRFRGDAWYAKANPWYGLGKEVFLVSTGPNWYIGTDSEEGNLCKPRKPIADRYADRLTVHSCGVITTLVIKSKHEEIIKAQAEQAVVDIVDAMFSVARDNDNVIPFPVKTTIH